MSVRARGIATWSRPHTDFGSREAFDAEMVRVIGEHGVRAGAGAVVLAGFMRMLTPGFLHAFPGAVVNIHPALLPSFPGTHGAADAEHYGVRLAGCSVHFVDEIMAPGPVIIQAAVPVARRSAEALAPRILTLEHCIYPRRAWLAQPPASTDARAGCGCLPPALGDAALPYLASPPWSRLPARALTPRHGEPHGTLLALVTAEKKKFLKDSHAVRLIRLSGREGEPPAPPESELLRRELGAFVTLKRQSQLRGCIGNIVGQGPLYRTVWTMARAAAFEDPRFAPLGADELADLEIEVSVLGPVLPCPNPEQVEVGRHGLIVRQGQRQGLLLPQVPVEWGWDREQFLAQTCRKAGLPATAWRNASTQLFWFEAVVF